MGLMEGVAVIVVVAVVFGFVGYAAHQRRRMFEAALAANQPELALDLIRHRRSGALARGLILIGIGVALVVLAFIPQAGVDSGAVTVGGVVLLGIGLPLAIHGYIYERKEGERKRETNSHS